MTDGDAVAYVTARSGMMVGYPVPVDRMFYFSYSAEVVPSQYAGSFPDAVYSDPKQGSTSPRICITV
jgi:hypothetical protein